MRKFFGILTMVGVIVMFIGASLADSENWIIPVVTIAAGIAIAIISGALATWKGDR